MYFIGEVLCLFEIWFGGFTPDQVAVWSIGKSSGNGCFYAAMHSVEALWGSLSGEEFVVDRVDITGDQVRSIGISSGNNECWYTQYISG